MENLLLCYAFPITIIGAGIPTIILSIKRVSEKHKNALHQLLPFLSFSTAVGVWLYNENVLWNKIAELLLYIGFTFGHAVVII